MPLPKAHYNPPFLDDVLCSQARPTTVLPGWTSHRCEPGLGFDLRHALQHLSKLRLFDSDLCVGRQMLDEATAAHAEVSAARLHTIGRRLEYLYEPPFIMLSTTLDANETDA